MKLSLWVIGSIFVLSAAVYWVMSHPNREKTVVMQEDLKKLEKENSVLAEKNAKLQREIHALQNDPRVIERRAREVAPLVRENEVIYQFQNGATPKEIEVSVVVKDGKIVVGGKNATLSELPEVLKQMKKETKEAVFVLMIKDDHLDTVEKKRLDEIIQTQNAKALTRAE